MNTQSPSSRNKQAIRVGERSVYGTDPFQESLFVAPTAQTPTGHSSSDVCHPSTYTSPQTYDWSGETLVASQAQHFVKTGHPSSHSIAETALSVPRKRASPGKKPWCSPKVSEAFIEHDKWPYEGLSSEKAQPNTDLVLPRQDQQLADSTSSEQESCRSTDTVLFKYQTDATSIDESPQKNAPIVLGAPTAALTPSSRAPPPKPVHSISPTKGTRRKKAWESSSPRDVSPRKSADKDGERPSDASPDGNLVTRSRPRRPEGTEKRIRSQSLSQIDQEQTPPTEPQALLNPEMSEDGPRRPKGKIRRIRSRSLGHLRHNQTLRTKPRKNHNSQKSEFKAVTLGRARGRQTKPNTNDVHTPTRSRIQTLQFNEPSVSHSSNHSRSGAQDVRSSIIANSPNHTLGCTDQSPNNDDPGYSASRDSDHSNTPVQLSPRKTRDVRSPDITNPPWLRRDISSSKYFPEETSTSIPARQPTRAPFWINFEGNLVVCFPNNVAPKLYEVDIHAKIHLSDTDEDGWRMFSVPGLPSLDGSQKPGRTSFSLTSPLEYQFDQSSLQGTFTCGPNLVVGSSRFGPSPILRVRNEAFDLNECHALKSFRDEKEAYWRYHHVLRTMSLPNGMPDNDLLVWLLDRIRKAVSGGPSGESFNSWFSHLDFPQLKAKMEMMFHEENEKDPSLSKDTPLPPSQKQAEKNMKQDDKSLLGHRTEPLNLLQDEEQMPSSWKYTMLHPMLEQIKNAATEQDGSSFGNSTVRGKKVDNVSSGKDEILFPAYFGGLACANNPMDNEDLSGLAWNFKLSISRAMNGKLQCRLKMDLPPVAKPFLGIDARDWTPNFALVNRRLAANTDWHETEVGDIVLQGVTPRDVGETTKVEIHFEERAIDQQIRLQHGQHRLEKRLPNVVDKVILGGLLSCYLAKALVTLTDPSGEEVTWTTDSSKVRDDIALPKLGIGYLMHLSLTIPANENEEDEESEDDLETISDIETSLDKALATPRLKKGRLTDLGIDTDNPSDVQPSADSSENPFANPSPNPPENPFADPPPNPPENPFADPPPDRQAGSQDDPPGQPPDDEPPDDLPPDGQPPAENEGHNGLPSNRRFWIRWPFQWNKYHGNIILLYVLLGLFVLIVWMRPWGAGSKTNSSPSAEGSEGLAATTTTVYQMVVNGEEDLTRTDWGLSWA